MSTHYHELIALAAAYPQVKNYSVAVRESGGSIVFLRKIVEGGTDKSYGVHVAKLAGLPQQVISRAEQLLRALETGRDGADNVGGTGGIGNIGDFLRRADDTIDAIDVMDVMDVAGGEMQNPAEGRVIEELSGLNIANLRPVEALLYLEKWQDELAGKQ